MMMHCLELNTRRFYIQTEDGHYYGFNKTQDALTYKSFVPEILRFNLIDQHARPIDHEFNIHPTDWLSSECELCRVRSGLLHKLCCDGETMYWETDFNKNTINEFRSTDNQIQKLFVRFYQENPEQMELFFESVIPYSKFIERRYYIRTLDGSYIQSDKDNNIGIKIQTQNPKPFLFVNPEDDDKTFEDLTVSLHPRHLANGFMTTDGNVFHLGNPVMYEFTNQTYYLFFNPYESFPEDVHRHHCKQFWFLRKTQAEQFNQRRILNNEQPLELLFFDSVETILK